MTSARTPVGDVVLRDVDPEGPDVAPWRATAATVFKDRIPPSADVLEWRRPDYLSQRLTAAWDGNDIVATFRSWDAGLTVPGGGTVQADAVSSVTVLPTHRRRGLLTAMMSADLAAATERGVPVAVLLASEATIYGRYGFGAATHTATWTVDARAASVRPQAPTAGRTRLVGPQEFVDAAAVVYDATRRPGAMDADRRWWATATGLEPMPGHPPGGAVHVIHSGGDGTPDGLLRYRPEERWEDRTCRTVVQVDVLLAATDGAYADLVRLLTGLDLVAAIRLEDRPLDEVLPHVLVDPRAARITSVCDFLWARLLDVPAALSARTYTCPADLAIDVVDDAGGWAAGSFRLVAEADGAAQCSPRRAGSAADLTLTADAVSGAWLGGGDLFADAAAGRVHEHTPGALRRLAATMRTARSPWNWIWF